MAECIVQVCRIDAVDIHPGADALELAQIKGWQCCVPKGRYRAGDLVTYIPIDAVIPPEHSDRWGITKYLSNGRVRCARLRGESSFGVIVDREEVSWAEGQDVREHYGITKYEPPVKITAGDAETPHPLFVPYTDIENLRHFPDVLREGEPVWVTEKIHGTNCRVGVVEGERMAGSMGVRRKPNYDGKRSLYWLPWDVPSVAAMLEGLADHYRQVILYGEVFGPGIQSLRYGVDAPTFAAFDLLVDGKFLDYSDLEDVCGGYGVKTVPLLARIDYSLDKVRGWAQGTSTLADHIREGVVVRPTQERTDPKVGRAVLKFISDEYLLSKGISDSKDV